MTTTDGIPRPEALDLPPDLIALLGDDLDDFVWALAEGTVVVTFEFDAGVTP